MYRHITSFKSNVKIVLWHIDINKSHVKIIMLRDDIIHHACKGQMYATIFFFNELYLWKYTQNLCFVSFYINYIPWGSLSE